MHTVDTFMGLFFKHTVSFSLYDQSLSFNFKRNMRKSIYPTIIFLSITLSSCTTIMENLPGVYTLDIQQGNVINQDMIDQLKPDMTKRQVLYVMGSSMLVDVFHEQRWDYIYSEQLDGEQRKQKRLSLFFKDEKLSGIQGDFRPSSLNANKKSKETTVDVPPRDLDKTLWEKITSLFSSTESENRSKDDDKALSKDAKKTIRNRNTSLEGINDNEF